LKSGQYFFEIIEKIFVPILKRRGFPEFDADGNQYHIQTETGDWALNYNAANRPTDFSGMDEEGNFHTVKCDYDSMGRRVFKKVISGNGTVTSHHPPPQTLSAIARRACYACLPSQSGNAAEAGCDLTRTNHPALWLITWDPTEYNGRQINGLFCVRKRAKFQNQ